MCVRALADMTAMLMHMPCYILKCIFYTFISTHEMKQKVAEQTRNHLTHKHSLIPNEFVEYLSDWNLLYVDDLRYFGTPTQRNHYTRTMATSKLWRVRQYEHDTRSTTSALQTKGNRRNTRISLHFILLLSFLKQKVAVKTLYHLISLRTCLTQRQVQLDTCEV